MITILDILGFLGKNLAKTLTNKSMNLQDRAKKFKKCQDSYQEFQEKPRIGEKTQGDSIFPFRTSVIIKPSEVSAYELKNYQKISSIMELRSKNYNFRPKSDHERSKNAAAVGKSLNFAHIIAFSEIKDFLEEVGLSKSLRNSRGSRIL